MSRPIALTVAGSDSSGGAGIQADLKTFSALGVYGASVITALTAQNTLGVQGVHAVPADFVTAQLASVLSDLDVRAAKTGMLATADIISAVARDMALRPAVPLVVDPVMVATSGDLLIAPEAVDVLARELLPVAALVTPNLAEAARLSGRPEARTRAEMETQAQALVGAGCRAVLVKGGHLAEAPDEAADYLLMADGGTWLVGRRIATPHTHGTGCTLSAAIVVGLATGLAMSEAVAAAKAYLASALAAASSLGIGRGRGPVDHLHAMPGGPVTVARQP
ncbi:MAG: bifunctional hydroxymethylpyrimidine kinase/phosphomethylpyrimidine kinase [Hyphomicrobiaceae bacterium]